MYAITFKSEMALKNGELVIQSPENMKKPAGKKCAEYGP